MKHLVAGLIASVISICAWAAPEALGALASDADKINYSVGFRVGSDFRGEGDSLNPDLVVRGIQDAASGAPPLMSQEEMQTTLAELQRKAVEEARAQQQRELARVTEEGKAFLAENAKREGVVTLPSGLQYQVIAAGTGKAPTLQDRVTVDYRGTLIDGSEFDSSYQRGEPASFPLQGVIAGWTEALQLMKEGDHWQLFVPSELAYGEQGKLAGRTLLFDVKLLQVTPGGPQVQMANPDTGKPKARSEPAADAR